MGHPHDGHHPPPLMVNPLVGLLSLLPGSSAPSSRARPECSASSTPRFPHLQGRYDQGQAAGARLREGCRSRYSGQGCRSCRGLAGVLTAPQGRSVRGRDQGRPIVSGRGSHCFNLAFSQVVNTPCRVESGIRSRWVAGPSVQAAAVPTWLRLTEGDEPIPWPLTLRMRLCSGCCSMETSPPHAWVQRKPKKRQRKRRGRPTKSTYR